MADATANASFVASDLLSQAEHGVDSQVLLVSTSEQLVNEVNKELAIQVQFLSRKEIALQALENSKAILVNTMDEAIDLVNEYAAEHLIISCENDEVIAEKSSMLVLFSWEIIHLKVWVIILVVPIILYLPMVFAKAYSGVSVDSFVKKITYQKLTKRA
jgi:histidinol dehydrogenase